MKNLLSGVPQSVRETFKAGIPLMIGVALLLIGGNIAYSQISSLMNKISSAEKDQITLTQKLKLLSTVSDIAAQGAGAATSALPDGNPALVVVSQLKSLASSRGIVLSSMKSAAGSESGSVSSVTISFTAEGSRDAIFSFLKDISQIAPLTSVGSVGINEEAGVDSATISLTSYWAPFPKTIPPINQAITDLNASEKQTLSDINNLIQPTFAQIVPVKGNANPNPFGQ
jgi:hypothetical protein